MAKPQTDGGTFEGEIARLYEALGYRVARDVLLGGQQIDLLAEKYEPEVGQRRVVIECKYIDKGSISNQLVHEFIATYAALAIPQRLTAGVMVTNLTFSRYAKKAAENSPIVLRTREELERGAINSTDAAYMYVNQYESRSIFSNYVPMESVGPLPQAIAKPQPVLNRRQSKKGSLVGIEAPLVAWLQDGPPHFLTVLADFGAGKTSLLERLKYELCKQLLAAERPRARVPVLFQLRDLPKFRSLDGFVASAINEEFGHPIPLQVFWKYMESGSIVPLLDGFDEAVAYADTEDRRQLILRLSPLINRSASSVILTCRPTFFVTPAEYAQLILELGAPERRLLVTTTKSDKDDIQRIQRGVGSMKRRLFNKYVRDGSDGAIQKPSVSIVLRVFDRRRIASYLKNQNAALETRTRRNWRQVYRFLRRVYDLTDLMTRPFLLEMITDTVLFGGLDLDNRDLQLGASGLYETYTGIQLERESTSKNRTLFEVEERQYLAHLLALRMHADGYGGVTFESIASVVVKTGSNLENVRVKLLAAGEEAAASDTAVCAFLSRHEDGRFYFAHKSFMEFFLARQIRTSLEREECDSLLLTPLSTEVLYFLGSFIGLDEKLRETIIELYERASADTVDGRSIRRNILGALCFIVVKLEHQFLCDGIVDQLALSNVTWSSTRAKNIRFESVKCFALTLVECVLEACVLQRSEFKKLAAAASTMSIRTGETSIGEARLTGGTVCNLAASETVVEKLYIDRSRLVVDGPLVVNSASIQGGELVLGENATGSRFLQSKFTESTLVCHCELDAEVLAHETVLFKDCVIVGLPASQCVQKGDLEQFGRISVSRRMINCRGVAFFDRSDSVLSRLYSKVHWMGEICLVNLASVTASEGSPEPILGEIEGRLGAKIAAATSEIVAIYRARLRRAEVIGRTR